MGRVLEKVSGTVWDQILREDLVEPLSLQRTFTLPEEVLRFRAACGHIGEPGSLRLTPQWGMPRSLGPVGLISATAEDVVGSARAFLTQGRAPDNSAWLSTSTVSSMLEPQVAVPDPYTLGAHWGLGWILYEEGDRLVYGHDGATLGQNACLRVVPDCGVAVAVLMNGGGTADFAHTLLAEVLGDVADLPVHPLPEPVEGASGGDRSTQVGIYRRAATTMEFTPSTQNPEVGLQLTMTNTSQLADVVDAEPQVVELLPVEDDVYVAQLPGNKTWTPAVFFSLDDGSRYVHLRARATQRVDG